MTILSFERPKGKQREVLDAIPQRCSCHQQSYGYVLVLDCGHESVVPASVGYRAAGRYQRCQECEK